MSDAVLAWQLKAPTLFAMLSRDMMRPTKNIETQVYGVSMSRED
jgi:hypothetical protein